MKSRLIFLSVLIMATTVRAGEAPETMTVKPTDYPTASEQLTAAETLRLDIAAAADDPERRAWAVARAMATAERVAVKWPNDDDAVFASKLLMATIFREGRWAANAIAILEDARPLARKLSKEALIDVRLARMHQLMQRPDAARASVVAAIGAPTLRKLDDSVQVDVLQEAALVSADVADPRTEGALYDRIARLKVSTLRKAVSLTAAAKAWRKSGDVASARTAAADARKALKELRTRGIPGVDGSKALDALEMELLAVEGN
jgi:hypothetical protein